jgi:DNA-binding transcriptional MerR regulator
LARIALEIPIVQNSLRKTIVSVIKSSALKDFDKGLKLINIYIQTIQNEIDLADEAVTITKELLSGLSPKNHIYLKRKEVSDQLQISMDTLRNWEMNGLLNIKRRENGYRVYNDVDIQKLKIIRTLRFANYSLSAILRMMHALSKGEISNIAEILNIPHEGDNIVSVCDKLIISLKAAKKNALKVLSMLKEMKSKYSNPPL